MIEFPRTWLPLLLRVDLTDTRAWDEIRRGLLAPDGATDEDPFFQVLERPDLSSTDPSEIERLVHRCVPHSYNHPCLVVVDGVALAAAEHPVLLVHLRKEHRHPSFRALPREVFGIVSNLEIANMDFRDYAERAEAGDGVFRGFR